MITEATLKYLTTLYGGNWSTDEKRVKLYELVVQCSKEFAGEELLSVEIGVFAGASLFCLANAHKDLQNGSVMGIDAWDNVAPLDGTNSPEYNEWWKAVDMQAVFNAFIKSIDKEEWSGHAEWLKGRSDSISVAGEFKDNSICILHQDGNHNVETITRELELWAKKIKMGGYWIASDTNWDQTKEGYAKLPSFGFELMEDFETWQIYKRVEEVSEKIGEELKATPKLEGPVIDCVKQISERNKEARPLGFGSHSIMPILLTLPDIEAWRKRGLEGVEHFNKQQLFPFEVSGIYAKGFGVEGTQYCFVDQWRRFRANYLNNKKVPVLMPEELKEQWYIGDANVGGCLSHYMLYNIMSAMPYDYFMVLEDDCRFNEGWQREIGDALKILPPDFDFLFVGSACAEDKNPVNVGGNVFYFPYREDKPDFFPQTGYCYIVAKKALPLLIATQRTACINVDVQLIYEAFKYLNIYAILPRLAEQVGTHLPK